MNYGLYLSASGVLTSMYREDVYANNLANVQTAGFKPDIATIAQRQPQGQIPSHSQFRNRLLDAMGGGALAGPQSINFEPGTLEQTGNPLDVALTQKNAFLVVGINNSTSGANGTGGQMQPRLTRDGRLTQNTANQLVMTATGLPVLDGDNNPITLSGNGPVRIEADGRVMQGADEMARLQVAAVDNLSNLTKDGHGLLSYKGPADGEHALEGPLLSPNHIEASGVDPVREMVAMINATRDVTNNATMIHYHDELMNQAVNTFGRVA
jgi:flagellar basal-body rod protein FlgG